jgi:hypothetical protein
MFCGGTKLLFYVLDKDIPKTKSEYESYKKLGKFQRHEKYPDPYVRKFIDDQVHLNLSSEQYQDFITNQMKSFAVLKEEARDAISTLYEARTKVYSSIMLHDLLKTQMTAKTISKVQFQNLAKNSMKGENYISYDQIFNINKREAKIERKLKIENPKLFARASLNGVQKLPDGSLPNLVSESYNTTIYSCESSSDPKRANNI